MFTQAKLRCFIVFDLSYYMILYDIIVVDLHLLILTDYYG